MMIKMLTFVKRPYKVRMEIRSHDKEKYTVTFDSKDSKPLNAIFRELKEMGYKEDQIYVDKYGYLRIVFKNMSWNDIMNFRSVADSVVRDMKWKEEENKKEKQLIFAF